MKNNSIKFFCNNIRLLRKKHNLSKTKMAELCNTTTYNIRLIEKGILPPRLSVDILFEIHREFGIEPKDMVDELHLP